MSKTVVRYSEAFKNTVRRRWACVHPDRFQHKCGFLHPVIRKAED